MRISTKLAPTVLASALFLSACSNDVSLATAPSNNNGSNGIVAGTLEAKAARPVLTLRNTTESVVGYMVVEKNQVVVALYPPCAQNCPTLVQGASVSVAYGAIAGYTAASQEANVLWWRYVRRADGSMQPDGAVQTVTVRLD